MELLDLARGWLKQLADRELLWLLQVFAVALATLALSILAGMVLKRLARKADRGEAIWLLTAFRALRPPLKALIWLLGLSWVGYLTHRGTGLELMSVVTTVREIGIVLLVTWFLVRLVRLGEQEFLTPRRGDPGDPTTVTAVGKLLRLVVVVFAGLALLQSLGYSLSGVLAFGGVGGIAVGFAAKDMLANFFGGLTIYMDKPFSVGDWVRSPDQEIEGVVENIGWRQTRIRTFDQRPLYVPNATFTQISVENPSRMFNRRIFETIGIRYEDVNKMHDIVAEVRQMLIDDERMETDSRTLIVNFTTFADSSINFFVYTFTKTVNWVEFHEVKQDILLKIADIIAAHGAQIAFPTSTLHVPEPVQLMRGEQAQKGLSRKPDAAAEETATDEPANRSGRHPNYGDEADGD